MSDSITIEIVGLQGLLSELKAFPQAVTTRVLKGAAATGASVIRKEAILRAPMSTGPIEEGHPPPGTLKKAIYQVRMTQECTPVREVFKVDVRRGRRAQSVGKSGRNLDAFYASWVEFGHYARAPHSLTKTAKAAARAAGTVKWVSARPFMRPALQAKGEDAIRAMRDYIQQNIPLATTAMRFLRAA